MSVTETTRPTRASSEPKSSTSAGPDSLSGHRRDGTHTAFAVEGQISPQVIDVPVSIPVPPAGSKASRSHASIEAHTAGAAADNLPGGQDAPGTQAAIATGDQAPVPATDLASPNPPPPVRDQTPPAAKAEPSPSVDPLLADPLLALAADVLGDLEKVRIANENRLRQLTRGEDDFDKDGSNDRGFGLDESHPDVARLAALVGMLGEAEHKATLNLQRVMRKHPLGPWMATQRGIGEKQGARLLAAIGDPYIRPEITREDGTVEPSRPRLVSELWAYCGYHVVPAGHTVIGVQTSYAGGDLNGSGPGQSGADDQERRAGVAPKRQRGQRANWSAAAKMRAWNIAGSMLKAGNREIYDKRKAATQGRIHAVDCVRCGPSGKPAVAGTPWSDAHRHADALRVVSKEVLKDLWREARRIHEEASAGGQGFRGTQGDAAASGSDHPVAHLHFDARNGNGNGAELPPPITEATPIGMPAAEVA